MNVGEKKRKIAQAYAMAKDNLVIFRSLFLPSTNDVPSASFHYHWSDILLHGKGNYSICGFRASGKSSYVLRAFPLYALTFPKVGREFIILIANNQELASARLKEIADEYLNNEFMNINLVKVVQNSARAFIVVVKDDEGQEHTINLVAFGKGSSLRGQNRKDKRPDIVLMDDVQDLEDSESETVTDKDWAWFKGDVYFLSKSSRIFLIGNQLGEACIIERIKSHQKELNFHSEVVPIMNDKDESTWPEMFSTEEVRDQRDKWTEMGEYSTWARENMCLAMVPEDQMFRPEMYRYFDLSQFKRDNMNVFTCCDLAVSEKETADNSVVCTVAVDSKGNWFILDCAYGRWNPTRMMDEIFKAVQKYRPIYVGLETVAYQASLQHFLSIEMQKRNQFFTIQPLKAKEKKEVRIRGALQPRFQNGLVWFPLGASWLPEMKVELETFPKSLHDDCTDALAYIDQVQFLPVDSWEEGNTSEDIPLSGSL